MSGNPSFEENLKRQPKPHRCNDRVEDCIEALFEGFGDYRRTLLPAWRVMMRCFKSKEGEEPTDPYVYLTPKNPCFVDHAARRAQQEELSEE